jgi:sensor histidine kinase YesM
LKKDSKIQTYYLRVKSSEPVIIPISIGSPIAINALSANNDLFIGIYIGIAGVLVLYNFFIFLFIRDKAYLFYVLGVFSLVFTQLVLLGFAYRLLWPSWTWFNNFSVVLFPSLAGIFILKFTQRFLNTKEFVTFNTITKGIIGLYLFAIISKGFDFHQIAFRIVDINALLMSILILHIAFLRIKNNYRPAKFFLLGWTLPLVGFLIFCLRNFGILPFNAFTNFILPISTAMEGIIFSLALADKINILKKENEQSQNEIIKYLKENEKHIIAAKESELIVEKLKKETLVSQFESLKNQVNPHFLFNSLNVLTELIFQNQDKAAKFVEELSEVYRYVLDSKNKEVIELKSELEFIEAFIYLLRIRFSDNISLHVNIINKDNSIMIPPLALQLLIENAVKHNVISQKHHLTIDIYEDDQNIVVRNNLVAKSGLQTQSGIGLNNIKSRYSFFSDRIIEIEKSDKYFTVKLPKLKFTNQNPGHASISH